MDRRYFIKSSSVGVGLFVAPFFYIYVSRRDYLLKASVVGTGCLTGDVLFDSAIKLGGLK